MGDVDVCPVCWGSGRAKKQPASTAKRVRMILFALGSIILATLLLFAALVVLDIFLFMISFMGHEVRSLRQSAVLAVLIGIPVGLLPVLVSKVVDSPRWPKALSGRARLDGRICVSCGGAGTLPRPD